MRNVSEGTKAKIFSKAAKRLGMNVHTLKEWAEGQPNNSSYIEALVILNAAIKDKSTVITLKRDINAWVQAQAKPQEPGNERKDVTDDE